MALPASRGSAPRPVVIRKVVKKGGHGHHGGSWKVAYADFVTAMMAFFLLMWLLASVESSDRAAIASYFQRPLASLLTSGPAPGGDRVIAQSGGAPGPLAPGGDPTAEDVREALEAAQLEAARAEFEALRESSPLFAEFEDQITVELTEEGLRIQLADEDRRPMFAVGSAALQPYARDLLREIAGVLDDLPNRLSIAGHTDAMPYAGGEAGYSNWELSADRANAARRALVAGGVSDGKVLQIEGLASSDLLTPDDPYAPANRRITVLLLTRAAATARTAG